jgi:hypothetical protein
VGASLLAVTDVRLVASPRANGCPHPYSRGATLGILSILSDKNYAKAVLNPPSPGNLEFATGRYMGQRT